MLHRWVWCSSIPSTAVRALAQDAENDVLFNILSLGFPWLGTLLGWNMLDPIGGMVLSAYIIWQWCQTLHENFINRECWRLSIPLCKSANRKTSTCCLVLLGLISLGKSSGRRGTDTNSLPCLEVQAGPPNIVLRDLSLGGRTRCRSRCDSTAQFDLALCS